MENVQRSHSQQPRRSRFGDNNRAISRTRSAEVNGGGRGGGPGDMRQLTSALMNAKEGTGEVAEILMRTTFRPRLPGLTKLVSKLSKEGSWRKSLEFFEAASKLGFQPDTALTNAAISACDKGGRWQKALEIFDQMDQLRIPRDAITYSATISALAKGKQWNGALQVFEHMQRAGVDADVVTCCSLINALERGGQWEMAETLFLEMCTVPESGGRSDSSRITSQLNSYNSPTSVLRAVVRHSSGVPAILPTVQENNHHGDDFGSLGIICSPVQGSNTSLPAGFADSDQGDAGTENESLSLAFQNMVSLSTNSPLSRERVDSSGSTGESSQSDATPGRRDSVSSSEVNQVVQQLGPEGSTGMGNSLRRSISCFPDVLHEGAGMVHGDSVPKFNFSHASKVTPNRVCCNALLAAYSRARPTQWKKALTLLQSMWEGNESVHPDVVSYNTVFKACSNAFQLRPLELLYLEMREKGVMPNSTTFNCLVNAAMEANSSQFLSLVIGWLRDDHPSIFLSCAAPLVTACMRCNLYSTGIEIFEQALQSQQHPQVSGASNAIFGFLLRYNDAEEANQILEKMYKNGALPPATVCASLIEYFGSQNMWRASVRLLDAMMSSRSQVSFIEIQSVNTVLRAVARACENEPLETRVLQASASLQIYNTMVSKLSISADQETFCHLIKICELSQQHGHVLACYDLMKASNFVPGADTMNYILEAGLSSGDIGRSTHAIVSLVANGVRVDDKVALTAFESCLKQREWSWALELCDAMKNISQGEFAKDDIYLILLKKIQESGDSASALNVLSRMQERGFKVDSMLAAEVMGSAAMPLPAKSPDSQNDSQSSRATGSLFFTDLSPVATVQYHEKESDRSGILQGVSNLGTDLGTHVGNPVARSVSLGKGEIESGPWLNDIVDTWISKYSHLPTDAKERILDLKSMSTLAPDLEKVSLAIQSTIESGNIPLAIDICRDMHMIGLLDFYRVPKALQAMDLSMDSDMWNCNINLEGLSNHFSQVIVACWLSESHKALSWGHPSPKFDTFVIKFNGESPSKMQELSSEILRLLTAGFSSLLHLDVVFPHSLKTSDVTIFHGDDTHGRIEILSSALTSKGQH